MFKEEGGKCDLSVLCTEEQEDLQFFQELLLFIVFSYFSLKKAIPSWHLLASIYTTTPKYTTQQSLSNLIF